jgi:hypothetical protein
MHTAVYKRPWVACVGSATSIAECRYYMEWSGKNAMCSGSEVVAFFKDLPPHSTDALNKTIQFRTTVVGDLVGISADLVLNMKHAQSRSEATSLWRCHATNVDSSCSERCVISRNTKLNFVNPVYIFGNWFLSYVSLLTSSIQIKDAKWLILICMWFGCGAGLTLLASSKIEWHDSMIMINQHPCSFRPENFLITLMADKDLEPVLNPVELNRHVGVVTSSHAAKRRRQLRNAGRIVTFCRQLRPDLLPRSVRIVSDGAAREDL